MMRTLSLVLAFALLTGEFVEASEQTLIAPAGWTFGTSVFASANDSAAAVAYKYKSDDPSNIYDRSLVVQSAGNGDTTTTEFSGKIYRLEFASTGERLLAVQTGIPGLPAEASRVHLLKNNGEVDWSKDDGRMFSFSSTGGCLFAWESGGYFLDGGSDLSIFSNKGALIRTLSFGLPLRGVVVLGTGDSVIIATARSVMRFEEATGMAPVWRKDLDDGLGSIVSMTLLGNKLLSLDLAGAAKLAVNVDDGTTGITYDPLALGNADPNKSEIDYARSIALRTTTGTISMFNPTSSTISVYNKESGALVSESAEIEVPSGFNLVKRPFGNRLFLVSPNEVRALAGL